MQVNVVKESVYLKGKAMAKVKLKELKINRDWCKGCGICVQLCPKQVLELDNRENANVVNPEACICCKLCELRCPDLAVTVLTDKDGENE